MYGRAIGLLLN